MKFKNMLLLIIALSLDVECAVITVDYGIVKVLDNITCELNSNGLTINVSGPAIAKGLHFGLITYNCDGILGQVVSKMTCKECGIYCNYNMLIEGCVNYWGPFGVGVFLTMILISPAVYMTRGFYYRIITKAIESCLYKINKIMDQRKERRANKLTKLSGIKFNPDYNKKLNTKVKFINKVERNRMENNGYIEILPTDIDTPATAPPSEREDVALGGNNTKCTGTSTPKGVYPILAALAICSMPSNVMSCDKTLYLNSNGKICQDNSCFDIKMYQLPMLSGMTTCFKDTDGELFSIKIKETMIRERYNLQYYTSNYTVKHDSTWECKKNGGKCWNRGSCTMDNAHPDLQKKSDPGLSKYGCRSDTIGCDNWCAMGSQCTWFRLDIIPIGDLIPVYSKTSRSWEVEILISYKNITQSKTINVNNPQLDVSFPQFKMPLFVSSFTSEEKPDHNSAIIYKNSGYIIKAADRNYPETDIIGDLQIDILKNDKVYNMNYINCLVNSCKVTCETPEPKVNRLDNYVAGLESYNPKFLGSKRVMVIDHKVTGLINAIIGNVELNNLYVEKAQCRFELMITYKCYGCKVETYLVYQGVNIKTEGIVQYKSNCTFKQKFMSCSQTPMKMVLEDNSKVCYLEIESLNQSIIVDFNEVYTGHIDITKPVISSDSAYDAVIGVMKSEGFITGIVTAFSMTVTMTIVGTLLLRIFKMVLIYKGHKSAETSKA